MKFKILWIMGLLILFGLIYNYIQISKLYVNKPIFNSKKIAKDLKITQISDYHANSRINSKELLEKVTKFNPHIIVLTGDIIDSETKDIGPTLDLIDSIVEINKNIFYINGNHELRNNHGDEFVSKLKEKGVSILDNNNKVVDINGEKINICGLSFFASKQDYLDTIKDVDERNYTILLSHSPNRPLSYTSGIEDLILSGHTHGGQIRLPIMGAIIAPGQGFFPKYDKGIFEIGDTILYIDSGLGNSILPIRFLNRVQISNITITS